MASIPCAISGSSIILMGDTWGSDPGGRYWGPGSSESSCQASLGRGIIEDYLRWHYFSRAEFSWVAISECSSTRFFQLPGTAPLLMCSTVENVSSKTTWY